ncbi:flagellar hook protein FlgE [Clostridium ganghwense]|uniref:Flagellar hook protein FlgE n=1 Tax=Clostridium ganghwense TaxID=312089 RepID=A0ABT4CMW0_9CLOT|nr:flagellar hook-basal body complex protein [Clostridium ganghwense]MCY6370384.1 flagellar hook-basal body complex protein [Clostridium ganghwense]
MLRSMYSGISGMRVNQTKLDVAGNNIANVGTTGFKSSRVRFQDMLSQNVSEALGPGRNTGGVNPRQVGLGVQVAGIDTVVSQGMMQPTSRNLDVAVDGTGYFMVAKGALDFSNDGSIEISNHTIGDNPNGMKIQYTRDGAFTLDNQGNLLTSDGFRVLGYSVSYEEGSIESIQAERTSDREPGEMNFVNADGIYKDRNDYITTGSRSARIIGTTDLKSGANIDGQTLELLVDGESKTITFSGTDPISLDSIIKQINDGAGKSIASSEDGKLILKSDKSILVKQNADLGFAKNEFDLGGLKVDSSSAININAGDTATKVLNATVDIQLDNGDKRAAAVDSAGNIIAIYEYNDPADLTKGVKWSTGKIVDKDGKIYGGDGTLDNTTTVDPKAAKGKLKAIDIEVKTPRLKQLRIPDKVLKKVAKEDGTGFEYRELRIRSFSIEKNGVIKGVLDDGSVSALGQIAMASFKNPAGLKKLGKNLYEATANSGEVAVRSGVGVDKADDNSEGYGDMLQGMLEMSNVDLAEQFTDMIVTQRAFQASGKMISTGDEILQDIINLKR